MNNATPADDSDTFGLFIDGVYAKPLSDNLTEARNPATGEIVGIVAQANSDDVDRALSSADKAFPDWRDLQPSVRESLFLKAADVLANSSEELKDVLIDEVGSTALKASYEVHHTQAFLRGMAGECRRIRGETYNSDYPGVHSYCIRQPLGIVVAISPFNFPLLLAVRKIGWALAAGNCVILKPSEAAQIVGLKLGEILTGAGFPVGVLNVLPGSGVELGDSLILDSRVKKVTFTGSTDAG
ncbi:MAG: aldehyde dehydrogenase family protein [Verrucomicrobiota bacterium]